MKSLSTFSNFTGNTSFLWKEIPLNKDLLGGKAEWAKDQLKNETADSLGNLLIRDVLTKDEVIKLLDTDEAKQNWTRKNGGRPQNSARYTLALQAGLKILGHDVGSIDALFGSQTKAAVIAFQKTEGLQVDGAPGPQTIGKMLERLERVSTQGGSEKGTESKIIVDKEEQKIDKQTQVKRENSKSNMNAPLNDVSLSDSEDALSDSNISEQENTEKKAKKTDYLIDVSNVIVQDNTNIQRTKIRKELSEKKNISKANSLEDLMTPKVEKKVIYGDSDGNGLPDWLERKEIKDKNGKIELEKKKEDVSTKTSIEEEVPIKELRNNEKETIKTTYTTKYLANKEGKNLPVTIPPAKALTPQEASKKGLELMSGDFELNKNGFISVLFLGKDASGIRPDSIMQFLIDPYSGDMSQVSISRDICVKNSKGKLVKLNSLQKTELLDAIEDITGQDTKYETAVDINNFESVIQPLLDKNFPEGITVDFGDTEYEIAGKKYTGELKLNAKELLTVSRARKGVLKNGRSTGGSDTARRSRQMEIIASALSPLNNNPLSFIRMASDASELISSIDGGSDINVRKFATDLFTNRPKRTTKSFTTKVTNGNVRIPYMGDKTHAAAYIDINKTRTDLQGFFGKNQREFLAENTVSSEEENNLNESKIDGSKELLFKKGMPDFVYDFLKTKESPGKTVEEMYNERGYLAEGVPITEQVPLNKKYSGALKKIEAQEILPVGTYSLILDVGKDFQKGYLVRKENAHSWRFEKRFPLSSGKNGVSNIPGTQSTPKGLVFVKNIINGKLDEIIAAKRPQGKFSTLNGKATVNTTALVLTTGESKNSTIDSRGIYFHETEQISKLGERASGGCIRTGTFIATEMGEYIKKNSLDKTPIYIANTEAVEKISENFLAEKLLNVAREFEGHPYDTSWDDRDGFASVNTINGKYRYLDNFTGEKKETTLKPLVCIDLIVESLRKTFSIPSLEEALNKGDFYMRRTTNFEKLAEQNSQDFEVLHKNSIYEFPSKKLSKELNVKVGDIITTTNLETGTRHVGFVARVDANGNPLTMLHSNYKGVGETPFFNSEEVVDKNHGKKRYDGFLAAKTRIDSVIRVKENQDLLAHNN